MRKCGHVVKNLSKMKVVVGDTLVVRWIWVSREILAKALFSKNSDWKNQMVLEFFQNFAAVCSLEKNPTGDVYNNKYIWALYLILLHFLSFYTLIFTVGILLVGQTVVEFLNNSNRNSDHKSSWSVDFHTNAK